MKRWIEGPDLERRIVAGALAFLILYTGVNIVLLATEATPLPVGSHGVALLAAGMALALIRRPRVESPAPEEAHPDEYLDTVRLLAAAIDTGDPFALGRSYRVSRFCLRVGTHLGVPAERQRDLEIAALLHDIGRTAIHRDVLLKPGRLDVAEREVVRTHPQIGYEILKGIGPLREAAEVVRAHHEQPNGQGYPRALQASDIPIESHIIAAIAAFDAMTCDRPYRRALSASEALLELREYSGTQFEPRVVEALAALHASGDLYAGLDLVSLERYSSGRCVSRAIDEHLAEHKIVWGGRGQTDEAVPQYAQEPDLEIELPPDAALDEELVSAEPDGGDRRVAGDR